jgi:hypothetical protein
MVLTLDPIVIEGFDIAESVGNDGRNSPDDMFSVKTLLNGILLTDGGAEGALDPDDSTDAGPEFERMAFAIARFQSLQFRGEFEPDGLVEPNRRTIKKLKEMFAKQKVRPPTFLGVSPLFPASGDTDLLGFSAARLTRAGRRGDWTGRNPSLPVTQMVPVAGSRTLVVTFATTILPKFRIEDETIACVKSVVFNIVTVEGRRPGKTKLICSIGVFTAVTVQLVVRRAATKTVDVVHVGAPDNANAPQMFFDSFLPKINRVFDPQTNIRFVPGTSRTVTAATLDGVPFSIRPGEFFILDDGELFPRGAQGSRFRDLQLLVRNNDAITAFIGPNLRDLDPAAAGRSENPGNKCWFKFGPTVNLNPASTPAHELGHAIGLSHIKSSPDFDYLMREGSSMLIRQGKIPSDTLDDLTVN